MVNDFKSDERGRIGALHRLEVLDTEEEKPFEKIVGLVQQVLRVPICAVSLVDHDRQWFKAKRGLDVNQTERNISFCTHAIQNDSPFIVRNAVLNPRFADNPLVTNEPHIRSYAGIPLKTPDGYNIGTLCAIDTVPREFPREEVEILSNFAKVILDELELRQIACSDALTGVASRGAWMDRARSELKRAQRYDRPLSVLIMDIDHFKNVNDTFGHLVGDVVIKRLADVAAAQIRDVDVLARFGGEEFVVLLPETASADAVVLADRIRTSFAELEIDELDGRSCSVSVGIAERETADSSLDTLLDRADKALYSAKNGGRNRCMSATNRLAGGLKKKVA